jgi:hypothetical protein
MGCGRKRQPNTGCTKSSMRNELLFRRVGAVSTTRAFGLGKAAAGHGHFSCASSPVWRQSQGKTKTEDTAMKRTMLFVVALALLTFVAQARAQTGDIGNAAADAAKQQAQQAGQNAVNGAMNSMGLAPNASPAAGASPASGDATATNGAAAGAPAAAAPAAAASAASGDASAPAAPAAPPPAPADAGAAPSPASAAN